MHGMMSMPASSGYLLFILSAPYFSEKAQKPVDLFLFIVIILSLSQSQGL
jgi:hypothetical protein